MAQAQAAVVQMLATNDVLSISPAAQVELRATPTPAPGRGSAPQARPARGAMLMDETLPPAEIVDRRELPEVGVTVLELANGVEVWMKPTDFARGEIEFAGVSPGGISLLPEEDVIEARLIDDAVAQSGVGELTQEELEERLKGHDVSVTPRIREASEGFDGGAAAADLELLFQLVYLYATAPRADEAVFAEVQAAELESIAARGEDVIDTLTDTLDDLFFSYNYRLTTLPAAEVAQADPGRAFAIYQDRFADMGDFAFVFVGDFDTETLAGLAQRYLGNLPSNGRVERWRDRIPDPVEGISIRTLYQGNEIDAVAGIGFAGPISYTKANELKVSVLAGVLDDMAGRVLRMDIHFGFPEIYSALTEHPNAGYQMWLYFQGDPARMDSQIEIVFDQAARLQREGPSAQTLAAIVEKRRAAWDEQLGDNLFWRESLRLYALFGGDDKLAILQDYGELLDSITPAEIQQMAQELLRLDRYIRVDVVPARYAPANR
jgi:zinc protease